MGSVGGVERVGGLEVSGAVGRRRERHLDVPRFSGRLLGDGGGESPGVDGRRPAERRVGRGRPREREAVRHGKAGELLVHRKERVAHADVDCRVALVGLLDGGVVDGPVNEDLRLLGRVCHHDAVHSGRPAALPARGLAGIGGRGDHVRELVGLSGSCLVLHPQGDVEKRVDAAVGKRDRDGLGSGVVGELVGGHVGDRALVVVHARIAADARRERGGVEARDVRLVTRSARKQVGDAHGDLTRAAHGIEAVVLGAR